MSAGIPNCAMVGLDWAAALGAFLKNPEKNLELLADVDDDILAKAEALVKIGKVSVKVDDAAKSLYVKCILRSKSSEAICVIQKALFRIGQII